MKIKVIIKCPKCGDSKCDWPSELSMKKRHRCGPCGSVVKIVPAAIR